MEEYIKRINETEVNMKRKQDILGKERQRNMRGREWQVSEESANTVLKVSRYVFKSSKQESIYARCYGEYSRACPRPGIKLPTPSEHHNSTGSGVKGNMGRCRTRR